MVRKLSLVAAILVLFGSNHAAQQADARAALLAAAKAMGTDNLKTIVYTGAGVTSQIGHLARVQPPTSQLNGGTIVQNDTSTYNTGIAQALKWTGGDLAFTFNNNKIVSPTDQLARFDPQFNSSYLFSYTQPLLRGFRIDQTRQQMKTTMINRDNAELNLKARTTNTLAHRPRATSVASASAAPSIDRTSSPMRPRRATGSARGGNAQRRLLLSVRAQA